MVYVNFPEGVKETLVSIGLLSQWDNCDRESREQHEEEITSKYDRLTFEERHSKWKNKSD